MEITAEIFAKKVGRVPEQDDLKRSNCNLAGNAGHWCCGWCTKCDKPRFECAHMARSLDMSPNEVSQH